MSTVIDVERLVLLLRGREGDVLVGCCGMRETHAVEPTPDEYEYIRDNIRDLLRLHGCKGSLEDAVFSGKDCRCGECACDYRRKEGSNPNACRQHAEYEVERLYMWGYLMDSGFRSMHDDTWRAIIKGLEKLGPDGLDHCTKYHLFRCLDGLYFTSCDFRMVWDFLKDSLPQEFAEFKCCDEGCCRLRHYGQGSSWWGKIKEVPIPILEMRCYGDKPETLEKCEYYAEDYLRHRRELGLTEPVPVKKVCRDEDDKDKQEIEKTSQEHNIEVVGGSMLRVSATNRSLKCIELFAQDNPQLVKMYTYSYLFGLETYAYEPIIHDILSSNAYACSLERQKETAELFRLLIRLGADIDAPTIINSVKIPLGNMLELYEYNYPGSPVTELFESLGDAIVYDSSDKVKDAMKLLKPSFKERESMFDEDSVYTFLRRYEYVKDPSLFEKIARDALEKYRKDWIKAGNSFPYAWIVGIGFIDTQHIGDVINGVNDGLSPDEIEKKVWG